MKEEFEPIKTQKEADAVKDYLVKTAMDELKISRKAAELRFKALEKSGMINRFGHPDEQPFQIMIDVALQIPQLGESEDD